MRITTMQRGLWETVAVGATTRSTFRPMYRNTIVFELMPIRRGDGSKMARTMAPAMMPNCIGNFDNCNGDGKSKFNGARTKRRGIGKLYPNWLIAQ
jgi:hypothetical protein